MEFPKGYDRTIRTEEDRWDQEVRYANDQGAAWLVTLIILVSIWALCFPSCASSAWSYIQSAGQ